MDPYHIASIFTLDIEDTSLTIDGIIYPKHHMPYRIGKLLDCCARYSLIVEEDPNRKQLASDGNEHNYTTLTLYITGLDGRTVSFKASSFLPELHRINMYNRFRHKGEIIVQRIGGIKTIYHYYNDI